ncbi:hypothetical protein Pelo_8475 [Pelomyxa schiedti]|nr:hypothetical protein Pelo_8475 [Pelomyxa schiedti]
MRMATARRWIFGWLASGRSTWSGVTGVHSSHFLTQTPTFIYCLKIEKETRDNLLVLHWSMKQGPGVVIPYLTMKTESKWDHTSTIFCNYNEGYSGTGSGEDLSRTEVYRFMDHNTAAVCFHEVSTKSATTSFGLMAKISLS